MARGGKVVGRGPSSGGSKQKGVPSGPMARSGIKGTQGAKVGIPKSAPSNKNANV